MSEPGFAPQDVPSRAYVASNAYVGPVEKQCANKASYASKRLAKRAIRRLRGTKHDDLMSYRCPHCTGFHIGHRPQKRRKQP